MATSNQSENMALFCDFENIALGVRDANYSKFDINKVLERLLLKGSIVVKKAYCDWDRYKAFKAPMHEAAFELIEIPHVRQSGKNSADIRMVVDALDLCYTKEHVDIFVVISGDSDFSPLVSKLRENNKLVIGVGVKNSTSDLLIANCDEFIYYDDLVRTKQKTKRKTKTKASATASKKVSGGGRKKAKSKGSGEAAPSAESVDEPELDDVGVDTDTDGDGASAAPDEERQQEALDLVLETIDALLEERGEETQLWGSMVKQTLRRRRPGFHETYYGFKSFGKLLEEAQAQGLLELELDERSGGYRIKPLATES